jgi:hypothetical protein
MNRGLVPSILLVFASSCSEPVETVINLQPSETATVPAPTPSYVPLFPTATSSPIPRRLPEQWQEWSIIPENLNQAMLDVYTDGLNRGNDPHSFSKIGDGGISTIWFLNNYDLGPDYYNLGDHTDLQTVIDHFHGSFSRTSLAAGRGFNTTIILDPQRADRSQCLANESPLDCEVRIHRPGFAIISLGTNQVWYPEIFESELRTIILRLMEQGVVPILATKADNLEGDQRINLIIASLACEFDLPLWNFWLAVQPLPMHGLQADLEHLSYAGNDFSNPSVMQSAWAWRNLTALQTLQAIWQFTENVP